MDCRWGHGHLARRPCGQPGGLDLLPLHSPCSQTFPADAMDKILSKAGHYLGAITGTGKVNISELSILLLLIEMHVIFHLL